MWFKMKYGKTTCDVNRPKYLEGHDFEVPERLRETLAPVTLPQMQLWPWFTHHQKEEFEDPTDWETEFFSELEPEKIFSSPGTLQSTPCLEKQEHHSPPL